MKIVERVYELSERYGVKMQQIALAWEWAKGVATPIVGATKTKYLDDAVGALAVSLTEEDIAYLEEPYIPHRVVGAILENPPQGADRAALRARNSDAVAFQIVQRAVYHLM